MTNDVSSSSRSCSGEEEPVSSSRTRVLFRRHLSRPVQTGGLGLRLELSAAAPQTLETNSPGPRSVWEGVSTPQAEPPEPATK